MVKEEPNSKRWKKEPNTPVWTATQCNMFQRLSVFLVQTTANDSLYFSNFICYFHVLWQLLTNDNQCHLQAF